MSENISRLEFLPNEIFIELFQYFNTKEIFQMFDNLNQRFNHLLRTSNNLIFKFDEKNSSTTDHFNNYINILTISSHINMNFKQFSNIRHLNLIYVPDGFLDQLNMNILPGLQTLSVTNIEPDLVHILYREIFLNKFRSLRSCYISQKNEIQMNIMFQSLPVLSNLQIGLIDLNIYAKILSSCPSLECFKFRLKPMNIPIEIVPHMNLKRMTIKPDDYIQSNNLSPIQTCLQFVPNLQRLVIDEIFYQLNTSHYLQCDWYASFIKQYLSRLRYFNYYLRIWHSSAKDDRIVNTVDQMKTNFQYCHPDRYQSKFYLKYIY